jgi:predicted helicase
MTTIHAILDDLARAATDTRDKGDKFERLMAAYLRIEPRYHGQLSACAALVRLAHGTDHKSRPARNIAGRFGGMGKGRRL